MGNQPVKQAHIANNGQGAAGSQQGVQLGAQGLLGPGKVRQDAHGEEQFLGLGALCTQ